MLPKAIGNLRWPLTPAAFASAAVYAIAAPGCLSAQQCQTVTGETKSQLETFVKKWYKLPINQSFTLIDSSTVDAACYRRPIFRASIPAGF